MSKAQIGWQFDNSYTHLANTMFAKCKPTPVKSPQLILLNHELAKNLQLDFSSFSKLEIAELFSGNILPAEAEPIAQAYAGHQYGNFTMLGDGRAILLGEHIAANDQRIDIQLKGSGPTPYSRQGDGRAALGPMLREYLISEAMFHLGIPTTRSLAIVATGEEIYRSTRLPGAILTRTAASHIRIGTFEYVAMQNNIQLLKQMVKYVIARHYPHLQGSENPTLELLKAVIQKQVTLIVHWMRVGFVHGVMNTDNISIAGETIDYGPCAFIDAYDPEMTFSSIDRFGRYAFGKQAQITEWNLVCFAETLLPLLDDNQEKAIQIATDAINIFKPLYQQEWLTMMRKKLGFIEPENNDETLINDLLDWMKKNQADYTNTFRALSLEDFSRDQIFNTNEFQHWHQRWKIRLMRNSQELGFSLMQSHNPMVIPRNHKVEEALQAANEDLNLFNHLLEILSQPYKERIALSAYQTPSSSTIPYRTFCGT